MSSRAGVAWLLQRLSALLLIPFAGFHFVVQHFTPDALSTGLTTSFRMQQPQWQLFYSCFLILALYHAANGLHGILADYAWINGRPRLRGLLLAGIWGIALICTLVGSRNIFFPAHDLQTAKAWYAQRGFPQAAEDYSQELRELHLLNHYLQWHTYRNEYPRQTTAAIFAADRTRDVVESGRSFDNWAVQVLASDDQSQPSGRASRYIFPSTAAFAEWALAVRQANARKRLENPDAMIQEAAQQTLQGLKRVTP